MKSHSFKQRKFIIEYLKDQNGTQAAIRAGYSKKTAQQISTDLLLIPFIRQGVEDGLKRAAEKAEVTAESIITGLKEVADMSMGKKPVYGRFGRKTRIFDSSGANRSLELLGKTRGMFVDKHDVTIGGRMVIVRPRRSAQ